MKSVGFNVENEYSASGISGFLSQIFGGKKFIVACIGTDAVIGDSLGPMVGSFLSDAVKGRTFVYGSFAHPVTAKEIEPLKRFLEKAHPLDKVLAIDAAVGRSEEVGTIKISDGALRPGLGVSKNLSAIGDANLIGVVAEKRPDQSELGFVRMARIWKTASVIAEGIKLYFDECYYRYKTTV